MFYGHKSVFVGAIVVVSYFAAVMLGAESDLIQFGEGTNYQTLNVERVSQMVFGIDDLAFAALVGTGVSAATSLIGGEQARRSASQAADSNAKMQREFAQHGVSWRVADAKAAGVHPLAALGANLSNPSPVYFGNTSGIAEAGQEIRKGMADFAKLQNVADLKIKEATVKKIEAEADVLGRMGQNVGPNGLVERQFDVDGTKFIQTEQPMVKYSKYLGTEAGTNPYFKEYIDDAGFLRRYPTQELIDLISEDFPTKAGYHIKNVVDFFNQARSRNYPTLDPGHGRQWRWKPSFGMWQAVELERHKVYPKSNFKRYKINKDGSSSYLNDE